jgi:cytochrome c oxidase assembly protein subunit 15
MPLSPALRRGLKLVAALALLQVALGGWVSTNYAVLACQEFPTCQGSWWPAMDFRHGFTLLRDLGETKHGDYLPFAALTAIHYTHRLVAYVVLVAILGMAWALHRSGGRAARRLGFALAGLAGWQLLSGLSNVVLGWPLLAALAHTAGAAVLITLLAVSLTRVALAGGRARSAAPSTLPARAML